MWRRIGNFLALKRNTVWLLACLVLAGTGERLWLGFAPQYLLLIGAAPAIVGLFDGLQTFLGAVYAYPGGWLADRLGQRRALMLFSVASIAGNTLVLAWHHWLALLVGSLFFLAWSALSLPITFTIVAASLDQRQHTMGIGVQSMVRRVPMMLGPLVGGWLITRYGWNSGIQRALLGCLGLNLITMVFQAMIANPNDGPNSSASRYVRASFWKVTKSFSPLLRELLMSDILIRFCERIPYAWVVIWALKSGITARDVGLLITIETVVAMLCYIPVAHLADKYGRRPFVLVTFIFFTLFPLVLIQGKTFGWLAAAFAVRGLKEFGEPARKALIINEATPELRARTYGAYYLIRDCIVTLGSFLGAWLWSFGPQVNFMGAALCGVVGTGWFWFFVYRRGTVKEARG